MRNHLKDILKPENVCIKYLFYLNKVKILQLLLLIYHGFSYKNLIIAWLKS